MPLSVLQQRQLNVVQASLCSTMDLVVVVTAEQNLLVYRTITWERVLSRNCADFTIGDVVKVKFSEDGKHVAVAFSTLNHVIITLESNEVHSSYPVKQMSTSAMSVRDIWWISCNLVSSVQQLSPLLHEIADKDLNNQSITQELRTQNIICRQHDNFEIVFFAFGIHPIAKFDSFEPLHSVSLHQFSSFIHSESLPVSMSSCERKSLVVVGCKDLANPSYQSQTAKLHALDSLCTVYKFDHPIQVILSKLERLASIQLLINQYSKRVDEHIGAMCKKWKECTKLIPLKLSLLKSLIDGYQLNMTTVEFLQSIAVCGMWHPAASTSFSQHWNEQGISRLRSGIDSTSRYIIRSLQLKVMPIATNICILAKLQSEAVKDILSLNAVGGVELTQHWRKHILSIESAHHLVFAIDDGILEAKRAREAMLLFLQFLKDGLLETSTNTITDQSLFVRKQCARLFQGNKERLEFSNPEHITGTFLSNHFQKLQTTGAKNKLSSGVKSTLSGLSSNIFQQKSLFDQSKIFREDYDKSLEISCPTLTPRIIEVGPCIRSGSLSSFSMINSMNLELSLFENQEDLINVESSIITAHLINNKQERASMGLELLLEITGINLEKSFCSRVELPCQGMVKAGKVILYSRKSLNAKSFQHFILILIEQEFVQLLRVPVSSLYFSLVDSTPPRNDDSIPLTHYSGSIEAFHSCGNLQIAEANASRGVLFLCDAEGQIFAIDLENEEEEDISCGERDDDN